MWEPRRLKASGLPRPVTEADLPFQVTSYYFKEISTVMKARPCGYYGDERKVIHTEFWLGKLLKTAREVDGRII
jgi:hypothetical protein